MPISFSEPFGTYSQLVINPYVSQQIPPEVVRQQEMQMATPYTQSMYGMGRRGTLSPQEYQYEMSYLSGKIDEYENQLGTMNQNYDRLDAPAQAQLNDLNKKTEAVRRAYSMGQLTQLEMFRALDTLNNSMIGYRWQSHMKGPGANAGDIWEDNGIVKMNTGKGVSPIGYTEEYRKKNTVELPYGLVSIPVAPGKEPRIMSRGEYMTDQTLAQKQEADFIKRRNENYRILANAYRDEFGMLTLTQEELVEKANEMTIKDIKNVKQDVAKAYGRERELSEHEQNEMLERESAAEQVIKRTTQPNVGEAMRMLPDVRKLLPPGAEERIWETRKTSPQPTISEQKSLQDELSKVSGNTAKEIEVVVKNWEKSPDLSSKVRNPIPLKAGTKIRNGEVYQVLQKDGTFKKLWYINGNFVEIPEEKEEPKKISFSEAMYRSTAAAGVGF